MIIHCSITATGENVWIVGFAGGNMTNAIVLHSDGSLTTSDISLLTVNCKDFGCPAPQ